MTSNPESQLFDFAGSQRTPETEDEQMVTEIHAALGFDGVPLRLRKPPVAQPRPNWRHYFPVAAAVILVIALLGASFSTLVPDRDDGDQFASVPPVVLGVTNLDKMSATQVSNTCLFDHDPPVIVTHPVDAVMGAQVFIYCYEDHAEIMVQPGAEVMSTLYRGTLLVDTGGPLQLINVEPYRRTQFHTEMSLDEISRFNIPIQNSRWLVLPDIDMVVDTLDMKTIALNDLFDARSDVFVTTSASVNHDGSVLVVTGYDSIESEDETQLIKINTDGDTSIISLIESPTDIQGMTVAPDGANIVYRSSGNSDVFSVVDLSNGETTGQFEVPGDLRTSDPVWIDNDTFVFTNTGALHKATLGSADTEVLYDEPGTGLAIYKTRDPNVVTLVQQRSNTSQDQFEGTHAKKIITVNTSTGKTTEYIGVDQTLSPNQEFVFTRNVILLETEPSVRSGAELHVQVIDPVTGEVVGRIDREDTGLRDGAIRSGGGVSNGDMRFFSWGSQHTYQVTTTNGHARLERIPPPPGQASESDMAVGIRTAPDASWIAMHIETADEWWFLDLTDPDATWVQLPDNDGVYSVVLEP